MILVTGGLGFIGLHTASALLDLGESCVLTQHRVGQVPDFIKDEVGRRVFIEPLDVTDQAAFLAIGKRHKITSIVHLAWPNPRTPDLFSHLRATNQSLENALQAAQAWGVPRISIASAVGVYGGVTDKVFREEMPLPMAADNPFTTYKKSGELIASYIAGRAGFEMVNLRIGGIWGPLHRHASNLIIATKLVHAAVKGEVPDFTDRASSPILDGYDMCYVKDCARAIALLQTAPKLNHQTYNIGSGRVTRNQEFVTAIKSIIPDAQIDLPEGFYQDTYLDITRLRQATGYEPAYDVERGITEYVGWLRAGNAQ